MNSLFREISVLIESETLQKRVFDLGQQITSFYDDKQPLHVAGVLKGCFIFMADLIRHIERPLQVDFMEISSYGDSTISSGNIKITKDLSHDIENKHLLIVEDIIDTGLTMNVLIDLLYTRKPLSVNIASLLVKKEKNSLKYPVRFRGFDIGEKFVIGYGMDYMGYYRNLPFIGELSNEQAELIKAGKMNGF